MFFIFPLLTFTKRFRNHNSPLHTHQQSHIYWLAANHSIPPCPAARTYFTAPVCFYVPLRLSDYTFTCVCVHMCVHLCGALALRLPPIHAAFRQSGRLPVAPCCLLLCSRLEMVVESPPGAFLMLQAVSLPLTPPHLPTHLGTDVSLRASLPPSSFQTPRPSALPKRE